MLIMGAVTVMGAEVACTDDRLRVMGRRLFHVTIVEVFFSPETNQT